MIDGALPGGPEELQVFSLNGRTTAWDQAVQSPTSLFTGNGVGALGSGSTRANQSRISAPPSGGDVGQGVEAGNSVLLDSSYAQVQSDVGIVYPQRKVVVTRPTAGDFRAFSAICTHARCLVSEVTGRVSTARATPARSPSATARH